MTNSLILYGSRARGDAHQGSDVDLMVSERTGGLRRPKNFSGLSVHFYPQDWLLQHARDGSLFVGHVALEGKAIFDPDGFLISLREAFLPRDSYADLCELAASVAWLLTSKDWEEHIEVKRRYFWSVRTLAIIKTLETGRLEFATDKLEKAIGIKGFEAHIRSRDVASFEECRFFADAVISKVCSGRERKVPGETAFLMNSGSIGRSTVELFEHADVQDFGAIALYA